MHCNCIHNSPKLEIALALEKGKATHSSILAWSSIVHGITKSWTQLSDFHFHFHSSVGEWTKKMPCIHTSEKHSTIKRNKLLINTTCLFIITNKYIMLKSSMMSERSLIDSIYTEFQNKQNYLMMKKSGSRPGVNCKGSWENLHK